MFQGYLCSIVVLSAARGFGVQLFRWIQDADADTQFAVCSGVRVLCGVGVDLGGVLCLWMCNVGV